MHPVILKYLEVMSVHFGARSTNINIILCVLFTIFWTIAITLHDRRHKFEIATPRVDVAIALTVFAQILTSYFIYKVILCSSDFG